MDHRHDYEIEARFSRLAGLLAPGTNHHNISRHERHELEATLASHPLLTGFGHGDLKHLVPSCHPFSYPANWTISAQSTTSDFCMLLIEGTVRLTHNHDEPRIVGPGEVIGLFDAAHHTVHHESAVSLSRVSGIAIESEALLAALASRRPAPAPRLSLVPSAAVAS